MAFPNTPVLTTFTGPDEDPLSEGGNWLGPIRNALGQLRRLSNVAHASATIGSDYQSYWTTQFAADQEAYTTIATLPTVGNGICVYVRIHNPGNATLAEGYNFCYHPGTGLRCFRFSGGSSFLQVGSTTAVTLSAGDKIGLSILGNTLTGYYFTAGAWNTVSIGTDGLITGAGFIGLQLDDTTGEADDFGGGIPVVAATPLFPLIMHSRRTSW